MKAGYTGPRATFAELLQLPVTGPLTHRHRRSGPTCAFHDNDSTTNDHYRLYVQDSWQIRPGFTLNYGLGWSFENNEVLSRPRSSRLSASPPWRQLGQVQASTMNFDPALGFAWASTTMKDGDPVEHLAASHHRPTWASSTSDQRILIGPAGNPGYIVHRRVAESETRTGNGHTRTCLNFTNPFNFRGGYGEPASDDQGTCLNRALGSPARTSRSAASKSVKRLLPRVAWTPFTTRISALPTRSI